MRILLIFFFFFLYNPSAVHTQEQYFVVDSLRQGHSAMQSRIDSQRRVNDSLLEVLNREAARQSMESMSPNTIAFVKDRQERERREERQRIIWVGAAVVILTLLLLYRKKKSSTNS